MRIPPDDVISREAKLVSIDELAESANLEPGEYMQYGDGVAKVSLKSVLKRTQNAKRPRFITVTAMTPYSSGLGKSLTLVALVQGLYKAGYGVIGGIRPANLGVSLAGVKGGAAGGGYSQIVPMEKMNMGLTGDEDLNTNANNLAMAWINGWILRESKHGRLAFNPHDLWFDAYAINAPDQGFRKMLMHPAGDFDGVRWHERQGYITVATEIQGIMAMTNGYQDMFERLGRVIIAPENSGNGFVRFKDIYDHGIHHTLAGYLEAGLRPNLMQAINGAPFLVHQGPFANISTGNNSVVEDMLGMALAEDAFVTENGFGSECGFHKLWNLVGSSLNDFPDVAVIVYTLPGLKYHGGIIDVNNRLGESNPEALKKGFDNLMFHIEHCRSYGIPVIPVHNKRADDQSEDLKKLKDILNSNGIDYMSHEGYAKGGEGALELADAVMKVEVNPETKRQGLLYNLNASIKEKIAAYVESIGGDTDKITYSDEAEKMVAIIDSNEEFRRLPLCPAKTHTSQTGHAVGKNPKTHKWVGRHDGFDIKVDEIRLMAGAGYVVPVMGGMRLLPGVVPSKCVVNNHYFDSTLAEGKMLRGLG